MPSAVTSDTITFSKRKLQHGAAIVLLVVAVLLTLHPLLLPPLAQVLVVDGPLQKADAIVVLGGGSGEREDTGARLYAQGWANLVFTTGGNISLPGMRDQTWAALSAMELEKQGVPADHIIQVPQSTSTCEDAQFSFARLPVGAKRVIIVTDPYHTRRAKWLFGLGAPGVEITMVADKLAWFDPNTWWQDERSLIVVEQEYVKFVVNFLEGCG